MSRKCRHNVATDDRRTFTDRDKVRLIQTLGNVNKDAMLDCESGFHQSEDKRKLNCHKPGSGYVTSILITKLTFAMFVLNPGENPDRILEDLYRSSRTCQRSLKIRIF